ncbi:substrate-binding periplasmic protein [Pseudoalteromonas xiamenensis]|uniref:substrate-binding periplasmic protein n=1 Tax=Pseudoalteromonas xiamenensis TaxID=882626 RepID=UPI0035EE689E
MKFVAIWVFSLFCSLTCYGSEIVFCYEDKALPPMFMGEGFDVPKEDPGASIEILQKITVEDPHIRFQFVRRPWKRCLADLTLNKVDAVIASYREERESFMVFPKRADGRLHTRQAISQFGSCLIVKKTRGDSLQGTASVTVAVPNGYSVSSVLAEQGYRVINTYSQSDAYDLVLKGVVDATVGVCKVGQENVIGFLHSDKLAAKYPASEMNYGFVAFSKGYAKAHPSTVTTDWRHLENMPSTPLYLKYIMKGLED